MIVTPTAYLEAHLEPISKKIDSFGGYNVLCGLIAAGGEPHFFITGNVAQQPTLAKEIYEAMADKFRELANKGSDAPSSSLILP